MVDKDENKSYCKVESVITIDNRGQTVLPKEIRDKMKIHAGDKMAVISCEKDGEVFCLSLMKVEKLAEFAKGMLGPVMKNIME